MDEATKQLLEHGILGAIVVFQSGLILLLLRKLVERNNDTAKRLDNIEAQALKSEDSREK